MAKIKQVSISKRGKTFQLTYYNPAGERRRVSAGRDESYARRLAVRFDDWLLDGRDPELEMIAAQNEAKKEAITLEDLFPIIIQRHVSNLSKRTIEYYHERFANLKRCPSLTLCPITQLGNKILYDYMFARIKDDGVSHATVNREAAVVIAMINKAVEWEMIPHNPLVKFRKLVEPKKRKVFLTPEQASGLLDELTTEYANVVEFAIYSGFRKENILSMTIEQITFHDITDTADIALKMKGNKIDRMPVGTNAVEVLRRAIGTRKSGYVFISPKTGTRYHRDNLSFNRAVIKLGLMVEGKPFRFHDLRHVFATWLGEAGVSLDDIQILLGHEQRSTTERYRTASISHAKKQLHLLPRIIRKQSGAA